MASLVITLEVTSVNSETLKLYSLPVSTVVFSVDTVLYPNYLHPGQKAEPTHTF